MTRWIALLRGVNVGGGNKLDMAGFRSSLASLGYERVATYIQSGNAVFDAEGDEASVVAAIAATLVERHGLRVPVVVRDSTALAAIAERHPGLAPAAGPVVDPKFLHVHFLDRAIEPQAASVLDPAAYAPDTFTVDGREIYASYPNGSGRSPLKIEVFERAFGVTATARNLNTVRALVELV